MRAAAAAIVIAAQVGGLPIPPAPPAAGGTAVIRGRVVSADGGEPLRHATVRVIAPAARVNRVSSTDQDGRFEITELPAGDYQVSASQSGYVMRYFGQPATSQPPRPVAVRDGATIENVDLRLPKGGVISGVVTDEAGEPMLGVQVAAVRPVSRPGAGVQMLPSGSGTTDDLGAFRLFGLEPGTYYVRAEWRGSGVPGLDDRLGYLPTYFPGAAEQAGAVPIAVAASQVVGGLTLSMVPTHTARLSGSVIDADGAPVATGAVRLMPMDPGFGGPSSAPPANLSSNGSFVMNDVLPGRYFLTLFESPRDQLFATTVTVTDDDAPNVVVAGMRAVHVTGRIVIDAQTAATLPAPFGLVTVDPQSIQVLLAAQGRRPSPSPIRSDLTFDAQGWPVPSTISVRPLPRGWIVKAVRSGVEDITDGAVNLKPGENFESIDIELTDRVSRVTGHVQSSGQEAAGIAVMIFPQDGSRWTLPRYQRIAPVDANGAFRAEGLPAGDYYAIAIANSGRPEATRPSAFDQWEPLATPFSIADGESRTVDLTLVNPY